MASTLDIWCIRIPFQPLFIKCDSSNRVFLPLRKQRHRCRDYGGGKRGKLPFSWNHINCLQYQIEEVWFFKVLSHKNDSQNTPEYWSVNVCIYICVFPCLFLGLFKIVVYVSPLSDFRDLYSAELVKMSPTGFPISFSISISTFGWVSPGLGALSIGMISDLLITILNCRLYWRYLYRGDSWYSVYIRLPLLFREAGIDTAPGKFGERKYFWWS